MIFDNDDWMTEGWVKLMGRDSVVVYLNEEPELKIKEGGCMRWLGEVWVENFCRVAICVRNSDAIVRFRTKVRTRTFQNRTEVRFKVQTIAGPDRKSSPAFEQEGKVPNLFELGPNRTL